MDMILQSLKLMLYGLSGVFGSLAVLYFTVKLIGIGIFRKKKEDDGQKS